MQKKVILILMLIVIIISPEVMAEGDQFSDLEAFIDGIVNSQLDSYHTPGAVVSVVKNGRLVLAKGYGLSDIEGDKSVNVERTLFRPGSVSKLFTWTAVMQLVEKGKLDLDKNINTYLDFEIPDIYPEPITLRHLMTHTPGFEDEGIGVFVEKAEDIIPLGEYLANNIPQRVYRPGRINAYSNYGSSLAGYIVERVSGLSFLKYIEKNIFSPLNMNKSTFLQPLSPALREDMAVGYKYNKKYIPADFEYCQSIPAGGLSSTAVDISNFMIAHLQNGVYNGQRILNKEIIKKMHENQFSPGHDMVGWTLGFQEMKINGKRIIHHGGDTFNFHTGLYLIPTENIGLFVSYNGSQAVDARDNLIEAFMDRYYPVDGLSIPESPEDFSKRAGSYTGEYKMARSNYSGPEKLLSLSQRIKIRHEDSKLTIIYGDKSTQWIELHPLIFRNLNSKELLLFKENQDKKIKYAFQENIPVTALIKVPWFANQNIQLLIFVIVALTFIIGCILEIIHWVKDRELNKIFFAICILNLLFIIGISISISFLNSVPYKIPLLMKILLGIPLISLVLTIKYVYNLVREWGRGNLNISNRIVGLYFSIISLLFILFLKYWNLILL